MSGTVEPRDALPANWDTEWLKVRYGFDTLGARAECLKLAGHLEGLHVLDIGTGSGLMAAVLAGSHAFVTTVDINFETILRARDRVGGMESGILSLIDLVVADALCLPFEADLFDAVFSFDSMHHMPDCGAAAEELERVLKPGGRIVIADLNQSGLAAIRALNAERGEAHPENACRLDTLSEILGSDGVHLDRHDYDFFSVFVKDKRKSGSPNTKPHHRMSVGAEGGRESG